MNRYTLRCANVVATIEASSIATAVEDPRARSAPIGSRLLRASDGACLATRVLVDDDPELGAWVMTSRGSDIPGAQGAA